MGKTAFAHTHRGRRPPGRWRRWNREGAHGMAAYLRAVWGCRYFWLSLVRMDLRTRYRRSVLGLGWSLLQPLTMTCVLCVVFQQWSKLPMEDYAPHVLSGLVCWNFLLASAVVGCQCFFHSLSQSSFATSRCRKPRIAAASSP